MQGPSPIRRVHPNDAQSILDIYGPYILNSGITFETALPSLAEVRNRIEEYSKLGWFVFEENSKVLGYAYASKHRARQAYQWSCEVSVYLEESHFRKGIARHLYSHLFGHLREKGYVNAYAGVTLPNDRSVKFHESMGFHPIGVYPSIGFKLGKWYDVGWWGLKLQTPPLHPEPPH